MLILPRKTRWRLLQLNASFQRGITLVFLKRFEVCKSIEYSSGIQLSDGDNKKGHWIIPCGPMVILRGLVPVNPLFAHKFLLVYCFLNILPLIFHQSLTSWSFLNTEFPEEFKTGILFEIWVDINGKNSVQSHGRRNSLHHPLLLWTQFQLENNKLVSNCNPQKHSKLISVLHKRSLII